MIPRAALLVNAQSGRAAVQVPAPSLMLDDGEVERRVRLLRPMERTAAVPLAALAQTHWERADRATFAEAWEKELAEIPGLHRQRSPHRHRAAAADLEAAARRTRCGSTACRPMPASAIIGRLVSPAWVAQAVKRRRRRPSRPPTPGPPLLDGRTILELQEGLQLRRAKVMGVFRVELSGFTDGMVDRLKAMGLISEIISWKLRLFVPTGANGPAILACADGTLPARPHRRPGGGVRRQPCRRTPPIWPAASRAMPRRCAATISPTAIAKAATGWSAMSPTRRAAACLSD